MKTRGLEKKSILVVGGTGYIGSALCESLTAQCKSIKAWDRSKNLNDPDVWNKQLPTTDIIFYLAGQTSSKYANEHPIEDASINVLPMATLLEVCTHSKFRPTIIFAGTVTEVGLTTKFPVDESSPDRPITLYDIHKLTAEKYLYYYANILGGEAGVLRLANVYGPSSAESKASDRGIVSFFIKQALGGNPITLYDGGELIRDYIFIDDVVEAFITAGIHSDKLKGEYYLIGSGKGHTIFNMATKIAENVKNKVNKDVIIKSVDSPLNLSPIESRQFVANTKKFSSLTKWKAQISLDEGISITVDDLIKKT